MPEQIDTLKARVLAWSIKVQRLVRALKQSVPRYQSRRIWAHPDLCVFLNRHPQLRWRMLTKAKCRILCVQVAWFAFTIMLPRR